MTPALAAALYVCAHSRDLDDARLLLDALGLIEAGRIVMPHQTPGLPVTRINAHAIPATGDTR